MALSLQTRAMTSTDDVSNESVIVPCEALSREALIGLVDAFVLQEGTDYGHAEPTLEQKRAEVLAQVERGEVAIVYDPASEEVVLVLARDLPAHLRVTR